MQETTEAQTVDEKTVTLLDQTKDYFNELLTKPELIIDPLQSLVIAFLIFWIGKKVAGWLSNLASKGLNKTHNDVALSSFISKVVYYLLLTAVIIAALGELGIQTTSLLAVMGAAGLAVGLALKDSLSNFASGVMIIMLKPFKIHDFVEVGGASGKVTGVKIFSTSLLTPDNKMVIIPNSQILSDNIVNYTHEPIRRVDMAIGVSYDDDLKKAREVVMETLKSHPKVLENPAPALQLKELGDSSVNFSARPWANTEDYWSVYGDLLEQLKVNLEAAGCSIPYPQRDIHMHEVKSNSQN